MSQGLNVWKGINNFGRGLHSHDRAGAKTGLAVPHTESTHLNSLNKTSSFLGPVAKSYEVLY
jgi:hypothetical protein